MDTEKFRVKRRKEQGESREHLMRLDKEELVNRLIQLEAHNSQLKSIIIKSRTDGDTSVQNKGGRPFDFSKCHFRRILLRIMYLGWDYRGLATQEDTDKTIEHEVFAALTKTKLIENRETAGYHRCGRTDKGVSSFGQVLSVSVRSRFSPEEQNAEDNLSNELQYCKMLNRLLPIEIRALCWMPIPDSLPEFSARFDCKHRHYRYYFPEGNLNVAAMSQAAQYLIGVHDFRNLCKMDVANAVTNFVRNISQCCIKPLLSDFTGDGTSMYCLHISGDAFLWHQIRCIVGILFLVGSGLESPGIVKELLDVETNPRKPQYNMALDLPLNLFQCDFEISEWKWEKEELANVIKKLQGEWTKYAVKSTMIHDCLVNLETCYESIHTTDNGQVNTIKHHSDCLLEGVKSKVYKPLMQRNKCSSLEERIEHYSKKRRIEPVDSENV